MKGLLVGIILLAAVVFLAFLATVIVLNRRPGQTFTDSGLATVRSGWRKLRSGFSAVKSGYDLPKQPPFFEMKQRSPESKYYGTKVPRPVAGLVMKSFMRPAQPVVFPDAASQPKVASDLKVPAADAYEGFAEEALSEDLDAMSGRHLFGERQLPAPPITDDQFRYVGDFEVKKDDPLLRSALVKTDIGFSNRGAGLWS